MVIKAKAVSGKPIPTTPLTIPPQKNETDTATRIIWSKPYPNRDLVFEFHTLKKMVEPS